MEVAGGEEVLVCNPPPAARRAKPTRPTNGPKAAPTSDLTTSPDARSPSSDTEPEVPPTPCALIAYQHPMEDRSFEHVRRLERW